MVSLRFNNSELTDPVENRTRTRCLFSLDRCDLCGSSITRQLRSHIGFRNWHHSARLMMANQLGLFNEARKRRENTQQLML